MAPNPHACFLCGQFFIPMPTGRPRLFCSKRCRQAWWRRKRRRRRDPSALLRGGPVLHLVRP